MSQVKRLFSYSKKYWQRLLLSAVTSALFGLFSAAPAYIVQYAVDVVIIKKMTELLAPFIAGFILLFVIKGIFMYLSSYYISWVGNKVVNDIRSDLYKKVIRYPISFFNEKSSGELVSNFLNDIAMIQHAASNCIRNGVRNLLESISLLCVAFLQDWKLAILMLIVGPFLAITVRRTGKFMRATALIGQEKIADVSSHLQETFVGIREIKSYSAEVIEQERFSQYLKRYFDSIMRNAKAVSFSQALIEIIAMMGAAIIFYVAIKNVIVGKITPGQLTSFFASTMMAYQPLKRLVSIYAEMQTGLASAERIFNIMDRKMESDENGTMQLKGVKRSIEFKNMSFAYSDNNFVLKNLNFEIEKGDRVGIVGASGSGKSTLCDLIMGFYKPTSGEIFIDGISINTISPQSLRENIGYVGQRPFLFNDTIFANVTYGSKNIDMKDVLEACKAAHAMEFIETMPDGFNSIVGENGVLLSGGQKQRLTIARAILKNPDILILDEPTSALDQKSEEKIRLALNEISRNRTVIIVSHRLSLIDNVDYILQIDYDAKGDSSAIRHDNAYGDFHIPISVRNSSQTDK